MAFGWFRPKSDGPSGKSGKPGLDWEAEVAQLEAESERGSTAFQGAALNKAGDVCLRAGDQGRALSLYGRAIDALLADGQREAARGVANKIIRVHPVAVRTLCTLTWLDLAARHGATALLHLRDYVEAAKRARQERIAGEQIMAMARVVTEGEFLDAAADALDQLNFADGAAQVRDWTKAGGSPEAAKDVEEREERCLEAAVGSNSRGAKPRRK
jgi:hypothetical protein